MSSKLLGYDNFHRFGKQSGWLAKDDAGDFVVVPTILEAVLLNQDELPSAKLALFGKRGPCQEPGEFHTFTLSGGTSDLERRLNTVKSAGSWAQQYSYARHTPNEERMRYRRFCEAMFREARGLNRRLQKAEAS